MYSRRDDYKITFHIETILHLLDCREDQEIYEEFVEEIQALIPSCSSLIEPIAVWEIIEVEAGTLEGVIGEKCRAMAVSFSVGNKLSELSTKYFAEGDFVAGMIVNSMADDALFQLDLLVQEDLVKEAKAHKVGITKRLEPPSDIPIEMQQYIYDKSGASQIEELDILESYMLNPVKSLCLLYLVDENSCDFHTQHDCASCTNYACKMRKVKAMKIDVEKKGELISCEIETGETILDVLKRYEIYIPAPCNGGGRCGKCRVEVTDYHSGESKVCLSCKEVAKGDCKVKLLVEEHNMEVLTSFHGVEEPQSEALLHEKDDCIVIVDIGTTTIAMQCVSKVNAIILDSYTTINSQRMYGADVISRMEASITGDGVMLKEAIFSDLEKGLLYFREKGYEIRHCYISANTTMIHLFMGYSCETLGVHPFNPVTVEAISTRIHLPEIGELKVSLMPGISTFVGADIVSGILACDMDQKEEISLLVDLGTNGEMAIGNQDRILVTSTAAGPAFEGGNITHGCAGIAGAISGISLEDNKVKEIITIGDKKPQGICGTGVIDIVYELVKEELVDETGLLEEDYFEDGFPIVEAEDGTQISFTQKDVREIQLAKSAIRAGIEALLHNYGVSYEEVNAIYVAGGFGYKLDIRKATGIGMFPKEMLSKIKAIGNSSLQGCYTYATEEMAQKRARQIAEISKEMNLASDKLFQEQFMEQMYFE